jgi:CubicO group peptidase (beta-lactamase class C family)
MTQLYPLLMSPAFDPLPWGTLDLAPIYSNHKVNESIGEVWLTQQLVTDVSGQSFPEFMRTAVFQKLGMNDSTYEEPLPAERTALAAAGTLMDGGAVPGGWHVNPEMAAGGLWSTPTDLAKLAIELALSAQGKANHVLTKTTAREMITPHWKDGVVNILGTKQDPDQMGLGFFVGTRKGRFGHIGGNVGYQATMVMFSDTGDGVVVMTNSDVGRCRQRPTQSDRGGLWLGLRCAAAPVGVDASGNTQTFPSDWAESVARDLAGIHVPTRRKKGGEVLIPVDAEDWSALGDLNF